MRILRKTLFLTLAFGLSLVALSVGTSSSTSAASAEQSEANYVYTAQTGDSYTELARASVIRYDLDTESVDLNAAQVTAAETWVTQDAGSPQIQAGQEVLVSKDSVQKYSEKAAGLSDEVKTKWQVYADAGSITNGELKDKVRSTVAEVTAKVEAEVKQAAQDKVEDAAQTKTEEDKKDDKKTSRRWVIVAIVLLLVLAAVTLIRSSNQKEE